MFSFSNNVSTSLAAAATSSATVLTLASSANLPSIPAGEVMALTLNDQATRQVFEIVYVTSISGANVTVERAQEGTTAVAWGVGDYVFSGVTAGQMGFLQSMSGFGHMQVFTSSGSFTVPAGVGQIFGIATGGGGGGSQCAGTNSSSDMSGAGGGAGGTSIGIYPVVPGQVIPITVGTGGATQQNGTSSSIGSLVGGTGGQGASFQAAATSAGGEGGYGYGGQINLAGGYGSDGQSNGLIFAGNGGGSYWGGGARASFQGINSNGQMNGQAPGAGGGGAYNSSSANGGTGANGIVVIMW